MAEIEEKTDGYDVSLDSPVPGYSYDGDKASMSTMQRLLDSFKRDPNARIEPSAAITGGGNIYDVESAAQATADSPLARKLKGRHLQMIAIGGSIGMRDWLGKSCQ